MKSKNLLLALALPAVFAACSNEEIVSESPVNNTEIVGANLVSNGMTIKVGNGVESRLNAAGWEMTDKLGLGWLNAQTSIYTDQTGGTKTNDTKVYANHMFQKTENGDFTTYGNVYEGYHFAYYAFQYMPQVGQMSVVVNPEQKEDWNTEHNNNKFHISAQDFIKAANVDANTKELKDKAFEVVPAVNELAFRIIPDAQFTEDEVLSSLNIRSIALTSNTGEMPFYSTLKLKPRNLPLVKYDKNGEYDKEETLEQLTATGLYSKAIVREGAAKTLTTTVTGEQYDLSGQQTLRMYNAPVATADLAAKADASKYSIKITVSAGYFTVKYTKNAETGSYEASNNAALEEIAGLLSVEGYGDDEINFSELIDMQGVTLKLDASMFTADYSKITCKEDWEQCVALANALGEEGTIKFNVTGEVKFDEGVIPMPNCKVAVSSSSKGALVIENDVTWSKDLTKNADKDLTIKVTETGVLNVNSVVDATTFVNDGVIKAGPIASISTQKTANFVNNNRVIVEYGAYVYPAEGAEGVIAFEVEDAAKATIGKINVLIQKTALQQYANVNTLIVSTDLDLNALARSASSTDDRYEGVNGTTSKELSSLGNVTIELVDGGRLTNEDLDEEETVACVIAKGASEVVDLYNVLGNVIIEEGAELTVSSSEEDALDKTILTVTYDVINKGTLNADTYVVCDNIDNKIGTTNVAEGYAVVYHKRYYQGGTAIGTIEKPDTWLINEVEEGGEFKLVCDVTLSAPLNVKGDVSINLNGMTLSNTTVDNTGESCGTNAASIAVFYMDDAEGNLTIKGNGSVTAGAKSNRASFVIPVWVRNGNVTIEGGSFVSNKDTEGKTSHAVYAMNSSKIYVKGGQFTALGEGSNMVLNCKDGSKAQFVLSGGEFKNFGAEQAAAVGNKEVVLASGYKWSTTPENEFYKVVKK